MKINLLTFGKIKDFASSGPQSVNDNMDIKALKSWLEDEFPQLKSISYKVAINRQIAEETLVIQEGMEVALLPPFSGG